MFAVIFEVRPKQERWRDYLALAKFLKPELERIEGFIDNERFGSRCTEGRVLSLSIWRDEKAVVRWRTHGVHHEIQEQGRNEIFEDYHLRVGEIVEDSVTKGDERLPEQRLDETEVGDAKAVTITEFSTSINGRSFPKNLPEQAERLGGAAARTAVEREWFESIYNPGKLLLLISWRTSFAARGWRPPTIEGCQLRHRAIRIIRDYGMFDRREAPQYYAQAGALRVRRA